MHRIAVIFFILSFSSVTMASHLRSGEFRITPVNCNPLTFEITIIVYVNLHSNVTFGGDGSMLLFGDGSSMVLPEIDDYEMVDEALAVGRVTFTTTHAYAAAGQYRVSYQESNRNEGIVNMSESVGTSFYVESLIIAGTDLCNASPRMLVPPIDRACHGVAFYHNPGAVDPDGDSLSFALIIPRRSTTDEVAGYRFPDNAQFYTSVGKPYDLANEAGTGPPVFSIDPIDGTITWDAPGLSGEYTVAFSITEWKFNVVDSIWFVGGVTVRDMQIIVEECDNRRPELATPADICVVAGETIQFTLQATDPDGDAVSIEAYSDAFALQQNPPLIAPPAGALQSTMPPHDTAHVIFTWQTTCDHIRIQPFKVVFKISDAPSSGPRLVRFYSMSIRIIAPPPTYESVTINPVAKTVTLTWTDYPCSNATSFQVWRRISKVGYDPEECTTGIPGSLKYELRAEVPGTATSYVDHDLAHGAQYCYRILATIDGSVPGVISMDTCLIPKPAEAPVITNVSVIETGAVNGSIGIRWTSPFEIDKNQYPPPYAYRVFRAPESQQGPAFEPVSQLLTDTTFSDAGLNTSEDAYRYRVELYVPALTATPVDTSSEASSVFLSAEPLLNAISLQWTAHTAWSNYAAEFPYHLIFRKSPQDEFVLIDSVHVFGSDFHYVDSGQYHDLGLLSHTDYEYKVMTRGTYGNPKVAAPLENFSQIARSRTLDDIPPCAPSLTLAAIDCAEYSCDANAYYNVLAITDPDPACSHDVVAYEILVRERGQTQYALLTITGENNYMHTNLPSRDKCYAAIALDAAGNRSDTSAVACASACTTFKLPNVITPDHRDGMNDHLAAFSASTAGPGDCARAVKEVALTIFNRWGQEVFRSTIETADTPELWGGVDNSGKAVSSGTYYYRAKVVFDTPEPEKQTRQVKGWVHVVR